VVELAHEICHVADMNSWFHTATLAKLKTPIGSPDLREIHQLYTGQVPDMTFSELDKLLLLERVRHDQGIKNKKVGIDKESD